MCSVSSQSGVLCTFDCAELFFSSLVQLSQEIKDSEAALHLASILIFKDRISETVSRSRIFYYISQLVAPYLVSLPQKMSKCFHLSCSCLFFLERKISSHEEGWKTYRPMITLPLITLNTFLKLLKDRNGFSAILVYHVPRKSVKRVSKQQMFSKSNLHLRVRQSWWRPSRPSWLSGQQHSGVT